MRSYLAVLLCALVLGACSSSSATESSSGEKVLLLYLDGVPAAGGPGQDQSGAIALLAGLALDIGKSLAVSFLEKEAEKYEARYSARRRIHIDELRRDDVGFPPRFKLGDGGALLFVRTTTEPDGGLLLDAKGVETLRNGVIAALQPWVASESEPLENWLAHVLERLGVVGEATAENGEPKYLALAVLSVVQKATAPGQYNLKKASVGASYDEAMELAVAGYLYPGLKAKQLGIRVPGQDWDKVKSILTYRIVGPAGAGGDHQRYEATAAFSLKQGDDWVHFPRVESRPVSDLLSLPSSSFLDVKASVLETSDLKRTLQDLAKRLDEAELTPEDLGLGED